MIAYSLLETLLPCSHVECFYLICSERESMANFLYNL